MRIWSGEVCQGDVGIPVMASTTQSEREQIHTGDIILLWHGEHIGTEHERWTPTDNLSAVVTCENTGEHYPMGIRSVGFDSPEWMIQVVKKYSDVIPGERWPNYGFHYTD